MSTEMPSGAVDFAHLERFVAGDGAIVAEVLAMFREQADGWAATLAGPPEAWRDVVHTIKGTSRGVGAFALGDCCARAEAAGEAGLGEVVAALRAAIADIDLYLAGVRSRSQASNS